MKITYETEQFTTIKLDSRQRRKLEQELLQLKTHITNTVKCSILLELLENLKTKL